MKKFYDSDYFNIVSSKSNGKFPFNFGEFCNYFHNNVEKKFIVDDFLFFLNPAGKKLVKMRKMPSAGFIAGNEYIFLFGFLLFGTLIAIGSSCLVGKAPTH